MLRKVRSAPSTLCDKGRRARESNAMARTWCEQDSIWEGSHWPSLEMMLSRNSGSRATIPGSLAVLTT